MKKSKRKCYAAGAASCRQRKRIASSCRRNRPGSISAPFRCVVVIRRKRGAMIVNAPRRIWQGQSNVCHGTMARTTPRNEFHQVHWRDTNGLHRLGPVLHHRSTDTRGPCEEDGGSESGTTEESLGSSRETNLLASCQPMVLIY